MKDNNFGSYNSGYYNSGDYNSGDYNSGDYNSGDCNSGSYNSGNRNSGYRNSGSCNSGDCNSGYCNFGSYNSGDYNSGYCNSGSYNSGIFCSTETTQRLFNKPTNLVGDSPEIKKIISIINLVKPILVWVYSNNMSEEEKSANPSHVTTGGFLKEQDLKYCWQKSWAKFSQEQKDIILNAPNFDADVFEEITGINTKEEKKKKTVTLELTDEQLKKIEEIINN